MSQKSGNLDIRVSHTKCKKVIAKEQCWISVLCSAWTSYSKLENSTSYNTWNSNLATPELKKTWKSHLTGAKTRNTLAKVELDTCSNSTLWNLMKLELNIRWACSSTSTLCNCEVKCELIEFWCFTLEFKNVPKTSEKLTMGLKKWLWMCSERLQPCVEKWKNWNQLFR